MFGVKTRNPLEGEPGIVPNQTEPSGARIRTVIGRCNRPFRLASSADLSPIDK
jgi:hypothetical protein